MWKELIIIIIVIAASYVFTITDPKYFDSQLMFIITVLAILVIYKSMYYMKLMNIQTNTSSKEQFADSVTDIDLTKLNTWLATTSSNVNNMSLDQQTALASDYSEITKELSIVKKLLQTLIAQQTLANNPPEIPLKYDRPTMLNLASLQTTQSDKLDSLKKEVERAKNKLTQAANARGAQTYPKIPVYSSCVISDANGDHSNTGSDSGSSAGFTNTSTTNAPNSGSGNNGILTQALSGLLAGGVNVNII